MNAAIARERAPLLPLFLVSAAAVGFEIALTRFFAVANWSEYGYWVISITMVGFAVSGVVLSLFSDLLERHARTLLFLTPLALLLAATAGYHYTTVNPFNPLELQNPDLWAEQLGNIGKYYLALFPFYFVTGLYVGLYFLTYQDEIPKVYGADLVGAGTGALAVLACMFWLHPFHLLAAMLPLLAVAALFHFPGGAGRTWARPAHALLVLAVLAVCEFAVLRLVRADFNEYKPIYPAMHVQGGKVVGESRSPRGLYLVLDNFTERLDTDFSNNFAALGTGMPPLAYGLYSDGNRMTSLPKGDIGDAGYASAALDAFPYERSPGARTLLLGTRGGFRVAEALHLGAREVDALEPTEILHGFVREQAARPGSPLRRPGVRLLEGTPHKALAGAPGGYDVIDIASDFQDQADANRFAFTVEAVRSYYGALRPDGVVSIPVSIRELTVYALKTIETVRVALAGLGVAEPARHIVVYRSNWNARILVGRRPFTDADIAALNAFADKRSFDVSFYPGIDPRQAKVWNDLPMVSFETGSILSGQDGPTDALMEEALQLLGPGREAFVRDHFFNLEAATDDKPFVDSALRLGKPDVALARISLMPREELGLLINLAVVVQAVVVALVVMFLPLVRWRRERLGARAILRTMAYFASLGLGFLFLEMFLIEKASWLLNDRTSAFAVVLAGMLVFSGIGSHYSGRHLQRPRRGLAIACGIVFAWIVAAIVFLHPLLLAAVDLPIPAKVALLLCVAAPLSFALGIPFSLGLYQFRGPRHHFLPWAWSLNGAFSVIATPLATLVAYAAGYRSLLLVALVLYLLVLAMFPQARGDNGA